VKKFHIKNNYQNNMTKNRIDPRSELPKQIEELADKICVKINEIEAMEEALKEAKQNKEIWMKELAEILDTSGYGVGSKIFLKNGREMKIKEFFSAGLPAKSTIEGCKDPEKKADLEEKKASGLKWLDDNGLGDVIKNNIVAILPRGGNEIAKEISDYLQQKQVPFAREESVHAMTLNATLKDALKQGKNIPFEVFNVTTGTVVEIK
jgi:hypothetical protein